ncbi:uncharacterized protein LOC105664585 [Ceratitis capitata]|uniref:Uncharacterized protein n=1 Tax=Ceratitis capitata TaxID=7213 RepID=W8C7S5_CERCA|nr:uncharacterized protein LOC105664585 [Ceratitis capitata]XP_020712886.1 uncharacterized protein LOC105664585 [Ceratitis capitata]
MDPYVEEAMDKVAELQQQTHFCINNYAYHHKNNEFDVLRQKEKQLRVSAIYLNEFLGTLSDFQRTISEMNNKCDEIDVILSNLEKSDGESGTDNNKENIFVEKNKVN